MAECSQQRTHEAARVEQATRQEVDRSRAACLEADSLRVILEQKNEEIHRFRQQAAKMQEKVKLNISFQTLNKIEVP